MGYLDDLSKELYTKDDFDRPEDIDRNKLKLDEKDVDRFGVGNWQDFVDFEGACVCCLCVYVRVCCLCVCVYAKDRRQKMAWY